MSYFSFSERVRVLVRPGALALVSLAAFPALAQAQAAVNLNEVVVTATRIAQPLTDVVADVSVVDREQIERMGVTTVPDILAQLPGLQAVGGGGNGRVYVRGADSRMTALYLDGVRVDSQDGVSALGGGVPWDLVPVSQIERIEVLRGPASAVYGADAMGGVVQIFTRRSDGGAVPYVRAGVGSNNTQTVAAGVSGANGALDYALDLGHERSDGINTRPDLVHTPQTEDYDKRLASVRLGYQLAPGQRAEVSAMDSQLESRYVPWGGGTDIATKGELSTAALKWQADWSDVFSTRLTLAHSRVAKKDDEPHDYQTVMDSALLDGRWRLATGTLSAVLEHKSDAFDSQATLWDPAFAGSRTQDALALGYGAQIGAHALQLNVRNDDDSLFGAHQTASLAYGFAFAPAWRATLAAGTGFRSPTLEQVYGPYGSLLLRPETNRSHEVGVAYAKAGNSFKAVVYRNAFSDMISSSQTLASCAAGFFCYFNVGQASVTGATLSGQVDLGAYRLNAAFDVIDPRDDITGLDLSLRARRVATLGVQRRGGAWLVGADLRAVSERFDDAANTTRLAGYALLKLSASRPIARDWRLQINLDNAADAHYEQVGSYPAPGRSVYVGVTWEPRH